jgi:hypothetical protein
MRHQRATRSGDNPREQKRGWTAFQVGGRARSTSQTKDNLVWPSKDVIDNWINIDLLRQGKHWWTSKQEVGGECEGVMEVIRRCREIWPILEPTGVTSTPWTATPVNLQCYFNFNIFILTHFRPKSTSKWGGLGWNVPIFLYFWISQHLAWHRPKIIRALKLFLFPEKSARKGPNFNGYRLKQQEVLKEKIDIKIYWYINKFRS